jgi:hypothetical protein
MTTDEMAIAKAKIEPHLDEEQRSVQEGEVERVTLGRGELEVMKMREGIPILRKLHMAEAWLDKRFGIETTGADRIPENQRRPPSISNVR